MKKSFMKMFGSAALAISLIAALNACSEDNSASGVDGDASVDGGSISYGTLVDDRDGQTYKTVKIGSQVWMAENLNYDLDGVSFCYDNGPTNCEKYGRLYSGNWAGNACPAGWHLPSKEEYEVLLENIASSDGLQWQDLKSGEWNEGNDKYGFSILPAGCFSESADEFKELGYNAYFWTSSRPKYGIVYFMGPGVSPAVTTGYAKNGYSVRCLKD